nr:EOG090X05V1 [Sida crystallina]
MLRVGCQYQWIGRNLRQLCSVAAVDGPPVTSNMSQSFWTAETNPASHDNHHEGRFYRIPDNAVKQLFTHGGLTKQFKTLSKTLNELAIMVRSPATEVIGYLKETDFKAPVNRYVLHGKMGTGKTTSLAHILHYGSSQGFLLVHVPWVPVLFRNHSIEREITASATKPDMFEHPVKAVEWLKHFSLQNGPLLKELNMKTTETYTWSKREMTPEGSTWNELIELGLTRAKYATDCVDILLKEIKKAATKDQCRVLVVIDGMNAFFESKSLARREDRSYIQPLNFSLTHSFLSITNNDWNNGAVVVSVDPMAHPGENKEPFLPRHLLGKQGFEHLDPFIPIHVSNYNAKEIHSQISYYIDRHWLVQPKAHTEAGRLELQHASGANPYNLMQLVAPY